MSDKVNAKRPAAELDIAGLRRLVGEATLLPWRVIRREIPHFLGGFHVDRGIVSELDHGQLKGPAPVIAPAVGIGHTKDSGAVSLVHMSETDAALIVAAVNSLPALLDRLEAADKVRQEITDYLDQEVEPELDVIERWRDELAAILNKEP